MNEEEKYIHLANSIDSLNTTWRILKKIKEEKGNPLAGFAFQFALIEYSKPFKDSNSARLNQKGKPLHKYRLGIEFVPQKYLMLHRRILNAGTKFMRTSTLTSEPQKFMCKVQNAEEIS